MMPFRLDMPAARFASENHLAEVVSVRDAGRTGRIDVKLLGYDGVSDQDAQVSVRLCVPAAGPALGTFFVPDVGDEVLVTFINADVNQGVVLGALWNGRARPPERLGGDGTRVDRWTFVGRRGTRIAIEEEGEDGALIRLSTHDSSGSPVASCEISRENGGRIEIVVGGTTLRIDQNGVNFDIDGDFEVQASSTSLSSSSFDVQSGQATFSGAVTANAAVTSPSVSGATYTPGAGNVW